MTDVPLTDSLVARAPVADALVTGVFVTDALSRWASASAWALDFAPR